MDVRQCCILQIYFMLNSQWSKTLSSYSREGLASLGAVLITMLHLGTKAATEALEQSPAAAVASAEPPRSLEYQITFAPSRK